MLPKTVLGGLREGYEISLERVSAVLTARGVERIACVGRQADPMQMRVLETEARDDLKPGQVIAEIRPGFIRNGHVIRYADVRVAAASDGQSARPTESGQQEPGD